MRWLVITFFVVSLGVGCGLPTIPFLDPPVNPGIVEGSPVNNRILTFSHNTHNDGDDFQGYELYYKLYTEDQADLRDADVSGIETTPRQPGRALMESYGFVRAVAVRESAPSDPDSLRVITSDLPPHIPTEPTDSAIEYRIDLRSPLTADSDEDIFVRWTQGGERKRGFRRRSDNRFSNPDELKSFWNRAAYSAGDPENEDDQTDYDIAQMGLRDEIVESGTPDTFEIVWFVLSYGIDGTTLQGYYSEPLRLQSAQLQLRD
ncbi:MAG: hypothetical protein WD492_13125 [Alkalispirochaeta sp.]